MYTLKIYVSILKYNKNHASVNTDIETTGKPNYWLNDRRNQFTLQKIKQYRKEIYR